MILLQSSRIYLRFRASSSLETGQCFHWKRVSQQEWLGVIRDQAVVLRRALA